MKKSYVIQWKSMVNGRAGKGTKIFDRDSAERLVEELNREYPQIHHEMVEPGKDDVAPAPQESQPMELVGAR